MILLPTASSIRVIVIVMVVRVRLVVVRVRLVVVEMEAKPTAVRPRSSSRRAEFMVVGSPLGRIAQYLVGFPNPYELGLCGLDIVWIFVGMVFQGFLEVCLSNRTRIGIDRNLQNIVIGCWAASSAARIVIVVVHDCMVGCGTALHYTVLHCTTLSPSNVLG